MYKQGLVSIVIPCFNSKATIVETLESVLAQSYSNYELIVVDDGSTDHTFDVVNEFMSDNKAVKLRRQDNRGLPAARNFGFSFAEGEFVVFLDSDDCLAETFLEECVAKFREDKTCSVAYTQVEFFERVTGIFILPEISMDRLLIQNCLTATAMIKSELFREIGMYDENLKFVEDWEMWIRMYSRYPNFYKIEKPLFYYRRRNSADSMTDTNLFANLADDASLYIYQKHHELYKQYGYSINNLLIGRVEALKYKEKYYNVWYRKLFYNFKRAIKGK